MKSRFKRKALQFLLPSLLLLLMTGTLLYQGLIADSTMLRRADESALGPLDFLRLNDNVQPNPDSTQEISLSQSSDSPWDSVEGDPHLPDTLDIGKLLSDNLADYHKVWEPWLTKAGIHDIEISSDGEFLAVGGGFLYDNELHVYRWNNILERYVRVWECGDELFQGDIRAVTLGDTDNNHFLEMAGACSDGYVYVFEQTHIFDPNTNAETRFDHVWTSPYIGSAWGVEISDMDLDYITDVVTAGWDGYIRWFEYFNHSGYPYSKDHWIDYQEQFRLPLEGHMQSLVTTDINGNGLPDVVVGTREGDLYIIENDGTVIGEDVGAPFAIPQDNRYRIIWENHDSLWSPIMKLDSGQLDPDTPEEIVVVARGQGVFTLDYDSTSDDFILTKMVRTLESWETPDAGYPLDHYIDWMVYPSTGSVTYTNYTAPYYTWNEPHPYCKPPNDTEAIHLYPYNTSIAQEPDGYLTKFDAGASPGGIASAILDFGHDEEATGDARPGMPSTLTGYDMELYSNSSLSISIMNLSISPDLEHWEPIPSASLKTSGTSLLVDLDAALASREWLFARYVNITVHSDGVLYVDAISTKLVNKQLESACSAIIGRANLEWNNASEQNKIIIGTVEGRVLVYQYDNVAGNTTLLFDSYVDERYTLGGNIWDIVQIPEEYRTTFPTWIAEENNDIIPATPLDAIQSINVARGFSPGDIVITRNDNAPNPMQLWENTSSGYVLQIPTPFSVPNSEATSYFGGGIYDQMSSAFSQPRFNEHAKYLANAFFDVDNPYDPSNPSSEAHAFIAIYYASSGVYVRDSQQTPLSDVEITGQLSSVLKISQIQPTMAWGDMDADGNEDLVLANGKLYLVRNLGAGSWELVLDYFEDINKGTRLYRNPQLVDFDADGDFDLIMSEENNKLPGLFYWVNIGSRTSPNWEFRRQDLVNLRTEGSGLVKKSAFLHYCNYTLFTIGHEESLNEPVSMIALNNYTDSIHYFKADFESQNSFIVGINPYLARVDMNLRPSSILGTEDKNYGYRILKTWDTEYELAQWTQAITATDLDGDGKRELVVGDFDNNLYVFEHLANNTYKRAYRSFDLSRQITTTESPYAAELLEGVSASFIRFEWQHVEQVIGGMDLDGDGFQEFAAVAGLTIYLFEHTGRDDSYQLIWSINLGDTAWAAVFDYLQLTSFTALAPSTDANYNGKDELLAAVGPFLFIFEGDANNAISEIFMNPSLEDMFSIGSKYVLPENGLLHHFATYDGSFDLEITQLYVGDVIKDTPEKEIIIVGVNRTSWGHEHGFGMIMRHRGVSFIDVGNFPRDATWLNPIYDLTVDDQDYDGQPEILLGHAHGVDSWEVRLNQPVGSFNSPSDAFSLVRQSILSGSLNYPNVQSSEALFEPFNKMPSPRETEVIALSRALGRPSDTSYLPKGTLVQAFIASKNEATGRLRWAYSTDNGSTWQYEGLVNNTISPDFVNDSDPCLFQDQAGHLWLAWTRIWDTGTVTSNITLVGYSATNADPWVYKTVVRSGDSPTNFYGSSSIFANSTSKDWISISYLDKVNNKIGIRSYNDSTQALTSEYLVPILDGSSYTVHSCDAIYQDHGPGNGSLIVAFAGRKAGESRIDNDIWVLTANWNEAKKEYNWSLFPIRVTGESTGEAYPDLAQLRSADGTVMLTFEMEGPIVACYSKTGGETWSEPEELLTLPDFITYRYIPALGISFATWNRNPNVIFSEIEVHNPTIAALPSGGFVYSYAMSYSAYLLEKLPLDVNTISGAAAEYATGAMYQYQLVPFTSPENIANYYGSLSGQADSYTTTVGYYLLQAVAQSLFSVSSNITNSLPGTTSGFLTSYLSTSTGNLYNAATDGTYYNILTRTNFAEYWKDFDFLKAERIDVGDTDGDARREIAIYSGNRAYINEIAHSRPNSMSYQQVWVSSDLGTLNDLAIYDANGNGFEELFVSAEGGNVFAFEIANLDLPRALLQFVNSRQFVNNSWTPQSDRRWPILASFDADGDGLDELVFSEPGNGYSNLTIFPGASITNDSLIIKKRLDGALIALDYRDVTFDGFPDLAYGTDQGEYGVIDVHYSLITSAIVFAYQNQSLNEPIKSLQFAYRASENLWTLLVVGYSQAVLIPAFGTGTIWEVPNFNGTALIGGTLGDFGVSPTEITDVVIVDVLGNIYLLDSGNGNVVETITAYSSSSFQDIIFSVAQLNEDGIADLLLAINSQSLVGIDGARRATLFSFDDFQSDERFRQILAEDFDADGYSDILLTSDSSFSNITDWKTYSSFETGTSGTNLANLTNLDFYGAQIIGAGASVNIAGGPVIPTDGTRCLTSNDTITRFEFLTPVKEISFYLTANGSAGVQLNLTSTGGLHEIITFTEDVQGLLLEYDADRFDFAAIAQLEISASTSLAWYIDELDCGVSQPRSYVRKFSHLGELSWVYTPPVDRIQWIEADTSDGLVSQVALVSLAAAGNVTYTNDPRGLVALDVEAGLPAFYGGLQENTHGGILGRMQDQLAPFLVDGIYVTELGVLYEFQLIDRLPNQTLPLAISSHTSWQLQLSESVKFLDTADFDDNGKKDVVLVTSDGLVVTFQDLDWGEEIWRTRVNFNPTSMELGDFVGSNITDIFLSFEGGALLVIDGATGLVAWKGILPNRNVESAMNIGDKDSDSFDDLALGLSIQGNSYTDGFVSVLSGAGDVGNCKELFQGQLPGPAIQMARANTYANGSAYLDYLVVNFINGLRVYNMTDGSQLDYLSDTAAEFLSFAVIDGTGLIGATNEGDLIYYEFLNETAPAWSYNLRMDIDDQPALPYGIEMLNDSTVVVGIVGIGMLAYPVGPIGPLQPNWYFQDSSARVLTNQISFVNYSRDSTMDVLMKSAENVYVIDGLTATPIWMTSLSSQSGDISSITVIESNETDNVVVGTDSGYLYKFRFNETNLPISSTIFVPWYTRYQSKPVTPMSITSRREASSQWLMGSHTAQPTFSGSYRIYSALSGNKAALLLASDRKGDLLTSELTTAAIMVRW